MRKWHLLSATFATMALSGCLGTGEDRVLTIDATGTVQGIVYFDANGTRELDQGDSPLALVGVRLLPLGTPDTVARAVSDADGFFTIPRLPVGGYDIVVDPASVGDSVAVVNIDPAEFFVQRDDSVTSFIAVSFEQVTVAEARALPIGQRVFVDGIALNALGTFGDTTVHIADASAAIRATRVGRQTILAGDSVRFLGTISQRSGQPTLDDVTPFLLAILGPPTPETVSSTVAAQADGGRLDAALVKVLEGTIVDTATIADGYVVTIDDGSGPLEVLFDKDVGFESLEPFVPDSVLDATGLLVPTEGGWWLKPRSDGDLVIK